MIFEDCNMYLQYTPTPMTGHLINNHYTTILKGNVMHIIYTYKRKPINLLNFEVACIPMIFNFFKETLQYFLAS